MLNVLFVPHYNNPYQEILAEDLQRVGVKVTLCHSHDRFSILKAIYSYWKPDILHLHWTDPFLYANDRIAVIQGFQCLIAQLYIVKSLGIKVFWTVHDLVCHKPVSPELEIFCHQHLLSFYDAIFVHGSTAKEIIIRTYQIPERDRYKIHVIGVPNYIARYENTLSREEARRKLTLPHADMSFLFFGLISPYKGVLELITCFTRLASVSIELLIVGKPLTSSLRKQLEEASRHDKRIKLFLRYVPDQEVQYYLNSADVVVLPFQNFLTSSTLLLAMSFGKAVIAPPRGNIVDVLDVKGGIFCDTFDRANLLQALETALTADLQAMGAYNRKKAELFAPLQIVQQTAAAYRARYHDAVETDLPAFKTIFTHFQDTIKIETFLLCVACFYDSQVTYRETQIDIKALCSELRQIMPYSDLQWQLFEHVFSWWVSKRGSDDQAYEMLPKIWAKILPMIWALYETLREEHGSTISMQTIVNWQVGIWQPYFEEGNDEEAIRRLEDVQDISEQDLIHLLQIAIAKSSQLITADQIQNFCSEWNRGHRRQTIPSHHLTALYLTIFGQASIKHRVWRIGMNALKEAIKLSWHPQAMKAWGRFFLNAVSYLKQ